MVKSTVLYDLLRVDPAASQADIRKVRRKFAHRTMRIQFFCNNAVLFAICSLAASQAFLKLAAKVHPDKSDDPEAEKHFITLKKAYEILKDPSKREKYDRTGKTNEESQSFQDAYERYRGVPLTESDVDGFLEGYRGSEEEQNDLIDYFEQRQGDVSQILGFIVGSRDEDVPRYVAFYEKALKTGKVPKKYKRSFHPSAILSEAELDGGVEDLDSDDEGEEEGEEEEEDDDDEEDMEEEEEEEEDEAAPPPAAMPECPPGIDPALFAMIHGKNQARAKQFEAKAAEWKAAGKAETAAKKARRR